MTIQSRNYRSQFHLDGFKEIPKEGLLRNSKTGAAIVKTKSISLDQLFLWYNHGVPIHMSDKVHQLTPIFINHKFLPYHFGIYLNPMDYYWVKFDADPDKAHRLAMSYLEQWIDKSTDKAIARIDGMFREN